MDSQLILLVVAGTVGLMLMAFSLVFFVSLYKRRVLENKLSVKEMEAKHQQEMLKATLDSQEEERNRLGTELHDGVGAMLSTIKMNLQVSQRNDSLEILPQVIEYLTETIGQVRSISHEMMPVILKKYGLKRAVDELFEKINHSEKLTAAVVKWDELQLDEKDQLMLYRIIQELTNNCLKHAEASKIELRTKKEGEAFHVTFVDDGKGFPKQVLEKANGIGLWNIMNRAQTLNAAVHFSNASGGGAKVLVVINGQNV